MPVTVQTRYTRTAMAFHWSLAVVMLAMLVVGWNLDTMGPGPLHTLLLNLHKLVGCLVLLLAAARLAWRVTHKPPTPHWSAPVWQLRLAGVVHAGLYLFLFAMPVTGILFTNYGNGLKIFGVQLPQFGDAPNDDLCEFFKRLHGFGLYALAALIFVHVAAACWHQLVLKDDTLKRMLPGRNP
ncbi:cytochrome b [Paraburkholderia sp. UCT31]|uniref:cytochrome b n=1 Tax=Paraburkholderia sp. UCT31 TaxID=2615209 RepID=UPI0016563AE5|nr:cytochrome b [Paraburkholderia sp. UCT31]MBC8739797.1 cytochrome b [Paraburkholderia sp. UCT31]